MRFIHRVLKTHNYDKLIVFPTEAGWLIQNKLCHKYKGKYLYSILDYAGENKFLFSYMTGKIVNNSGLCSITSPAYKCFLPDKDYSVSHNIQYIDKKLIEQYRSKNHDTNKPIVLSFIGSVRFIDKLKKLITLFKNDPRFNLQFIGRGSEQLTEFCVQEKVNNVTLIGRFEITQLSGFYMETDIAINVYGNRTPYLDYALSNKLYSAASMGMPILVSPDTYMAEIAEKRGFGYSIDLEDPLVPDKVFEFYQNINRDDMLAACDAFMESVFNDEKTYADIFKAFINNTTDHL